MGVLCCVVRRNHQRMKIQSESVRIFIRKWLSFDSWCHISSHIHNISDQRTYMQQRKCKETQQSFHQEPQYTECTCHIVYKYEYIHPVRDGSATRRVIHADTANLYAPSPAVHLYLVQDDDARHRPGNSALGSTP